MANNFTHCEIYNHCQKLNIQIIIQHVSESPHVEPLLFHVTIPRRRPEVTSSRPAYREGA